MEERRMTLFARRRQMEKPTRDADELREQYFIILNERRVEQWTIR